MTFLSIPFYILFIVTLVLFYFAKNNRQKQIILLLASYIFYGWWDARFLLLLIGQTWISWYIAIKIEKNQVDASRKRYCLTGVTVSLVILGVFKYFNFFMDTAYRLIGSNKSHIWNIVLPVGISFYTFQAMSYCIDVYRKRIGARKSFWEVSLYVSFFPQLVAGPIVRAADFLPQLEEEKFIIKKNIEEGMQIFLLGAIKKAVVADRLAVCVDAVFATPKAYSGLSILFAALSYYIQIYCDFSGYSDMAIGVAKCFGYDLCRNFNLPFISKNPTEFWKRWHISLSTWLQDYLYISLGGNRRGEIRTYINLLLTMVLGGLWHGASWNFVLWGLLHGLALVIHKLWMKIGIGKVNDWCNRMWTLLSIILINIWVAFCFMIFRSPTIEKTWTLISRMITWQAGVDYIYVYTIIFTFVLIIIGLISWFRFDREGRYPIVNLDGFVAKIGLVVAVWILILFAYVGDTAFIYFQF